MSETLLKQAIKKSFMYKEIVRFCQEIKQLAKSFDSYSEFYKHCQTIKNHPLKQSDFNRLVSVASVEAGLM